MSGGIESHVVIVVGVCYVLLKIELVCFISIFCFFFFFKQKTAYEIYQCDWSSDVCSSDLLFFLGIQPNTGLSERLITSGYLPKDYDPLSMNP